MKQDLLKLKALCRAAKFPLTDSGFCYYHEQNKQAWFAFAAQLLVPPSTPTSCVVLVKEN